MKKYDFDKAKKIISENVNNISSASLGMHEDWFWTAETIWEDGQFKRDLPTTEESNSMFDECLTARRGGMSILSKEAEKYNKIHIAGLYASDWATPTIQLVFKDGTDKMIPCFQGEDNDEFGEKTATVAYKQSQMLGCLSGPVQANITPLSNE